MQIPTVNRLLLVCLVSIFTALSLTSNNYFLTRIALIVVEVQKITHKPCLYNSTGTGILFTYF